ncbi:hypothetical protein CUMW_269490 [Citrus unshiu]|uniref:Uncharacterized protein n=1 Tax=Citrus unshiu TaxID=55188 RepID=A0A2H5QWY1_CITUN|nr:hypothetical protein CUMW_269490 [Citrus unshiu]
MADIEEQNETFFNLDERPKRRKQTKKKHLLKRSVDDKVIVEYNQYGVPVGDGANDLRSYIGVLVRDSISILYDDWRRVPLEIKDKLWDHLQDKSNKAKTIREQIKYNHCLGSTSYSGMLYRKKDEIAVFLDQNQKESNLDPPKSTQILYNLRMANNQPKT